ncbi:MAG: arginine--tRNA ligase, partial [Candidatus Omnitrophica bacterium]|nr:arginine--tRNA ligase [Candidatus Omnitrophota bacterium]
MDVISELSKKLNIPEKFFEIPKDTSMGDIACKYAFTKENKIKYAEQLVKKALKLKMVETARNVGPYVNIFLSWTQIGNELLKADILKGKNKGKIVIEHTSTNPTGPIHIGRLRNSLIGDSLCRIYDFYGFDVKKHYYVNDIGRQVAIITWGIENKIKPVKELIEKYDKYKNKPDFKTFFTYVEAYKKISKNIKFDSEIDDMLRKSESGDEKTLRKISKTARNCLKG